LDSPFASNSMIFKYANNWRQKYSRPMKLFVPVLIFAVLSMFIVSCGGGETESKPDSKNVVDPTPSPTLAAPVVPSAPDNSEPEPEDSDSSTKPSESQESADPTPRPDDSKNGSTPSPTPDPSSIPDPKPSPTPTPKVTSAPEPDPPLFTGYDIEFSEGDFWRFR
jgi:hypothetical protein